MPTPILRKLHTILESKKLPLLLALTAMVLVLGSVDTGLQMSDYSHRQKLQHPDQRFSEQGPLTALFAFTSGNPTINHYAMEIGKLPWWTYSQLQFKFFRPLAAATHWLDYRFWPNHPAVMHVHSLLWFGALIFTASTLYRKIIPHLGIAGLAALLFALDDAHGIPAGWIANRNTLIAGVFGCLCLYFHDRWRRDHWKAGAVLGPVCLLLSLLSAEAGLGIGAYIVAYQLFLDPKPWRNRMMTLAPYLAIAMGWWITYHRLGYGTSGSGAYIDPGQDPISFLFALVERMPLLLYGQWLLPDSAIYGFLPQPFAQIMLLVACLLLSGIALIFLPLIIHDRVARFLASGMVLALLPVCATSPSNRLLIFSGLGAMGLLAQFLSAVIHKQTGLPTAKLWRASAWTLTAILIFIHLVAAPLLLPRQSHSIADMTDRLLTKPLLKLSETESLAGKTVVFINPPIPFVYAHINDVCKELGISPPGRTRVLGSGLSSSMVIKRVDDYSLEVEPQRGFITNSFDLISRGPSHPMRIGQRVQLREMQAEILSLTDDQRPLRVRFTFSQPLEDSSLAFYTWQNDSFVRYQPPNDGESIQLAKVSLRKR